MTRKAALLLCMVLLVSCAQMDRPEADQWIGRTKQQLVENWGQPQIERKLDNGTELLMYDREETLGFFSSEPLSGSDYQQSGAYKTDTKPATYICRYQILLDSRQVVSRVDADPEICLQQ